MLDVAVAVPAPSPHKSRRALSAQKSEEAILHIFWLSQEEMI